MRIDNKRVCEYDGCNNLSRIDHIINHLVKRGRFCEKHHRIRFPRKIFRRSLSINSWRHKNNFMKCIICKWEGPCDNHRKIHQGGYVKDNVISVCPNCHRLHHARIKIIDIL